MKEQWERLLKVLEGMLAVYQVLLTLSRHKKQVLIAANVEELEEITRQEDQHVLQIGKLEEARSRLAAYLLNSSGKTPTLTELRQAAPTEFAARLDSFDEQLRMIIKEMAPLNKLNNELIDQALRFVNYNINVLTQTAVGPTYAAKGQTQQQTPKRTILDARA